MAVTRKRRSNPAKSAFAERLREQAFASVVDADVDLRTETSEPVTFSASGGREWTKQTAPPLPMSMRDDPLSAYVNSMNLWMLMATGWCEIVRASWGLD